MHKTTLPPLDGLLAVVAVADTGSVTAAALAMGLTHSSVSRRVRHVEDWLGTQLFERQGRGVALTPAGRRLALRAREAFAVISREAGQWRTQRGPAVVRVSVLPSFAKLWLLPRLSRIQTRAPEIRCELSIEHGLADFETDRVDVAIRYGVGKWRGLRATQLFKEVLTPVASVGMAERLGRRPTPERISNEVLIHDSDAGNWRAWFGSAGMPFKPRQKDLRFEDYDVVLSAAKAGLGIALLRRPLADDVLRQGGLRLISRRSVDNTKALYAVTRVSTDRHVTQVFVERLLSEAKLALGRGYVST